MASALSTEIWPPSATRSASHSEPLGNFDRSALLGPSSSCSDIRVSAPDRTDPPALDLARIQRARPDLVSRLFVFRRLLSDAKSRLEERVRGAPAHAALVLQHDPLIVGAFCPEIDTVILLALPDELADELGPPVGPEEIGPARRLVTLNRLTPISEGFAADIEPGPLARGLHGGVSPLLADLVCEPGRALDALKQEVPEEEWERCRDFGLKLLGRERPHRDGRPFRSEREGELGTQPLVELPPRARKKRSKKRLLLYLVLLLLAAPVGLFVTAQIVLRHVPYAIPPELQPPKPGADAVLGRGLRLRYLGTAGWEISDGQTTVWVDPVPTRPTLTELCTGPLTPDREAQRAMKLRYADAILVNHAHFDHVLDVPDLALRPNAVVIGTQSVLNLCRARGVKPDKLILAVGGKAIRVGTFSITPHASAHGPIGPLTDPMPGAIPSDAQELWFWDYTQDGTRSYRLEANQTSVYVSAGSPLPPGEEFLSGGRIGPTGTIMIGLAGPVPQASLEACMAEVQPSVVLASHMDNFFHPLDKGLSLLPGVDLSRFAARVKAIRPEAKTYVLDYGQVMFVSPDGE